MSQVQKKGLAAILILALTLLSVSLVSKYTPFLENLELKNYDFFLAVIRGPQPLPDDIIIIAIDDASRTEFELSKDLDYPWPRSVHADLIRKLNSVGAELIVYDVFFEAETEPVEDAALADAIFESDIPVVIAAAIEVVDDPRFSMVRELLPLQDLVDDGAKIGYATLNPDRDGTLRNGRLAVGGRKTLATAALEALQLDPDYYALPVSAYEGSDPEILINYVGGTRSIPTVSFYQAYEMEEDLPAGYFEGKKVFIGYSLAVTDLVEGSVQDHYPSPYDSLRGTATMPGVEIHANIMNTILRQDFISRLSNRNMWLVILGLALTTTLAVLSPKSFSIKILLSLLLLVGFILAAALIFIHFQVWIYVIQPVSIIVVIFGLNILYQYRATEKERAHIRRALSGYVSREVMQEILKDPDHLELGGTQVEATVLFSDIAGFSKISETTTPREVATLLNNYFTRMGDIIMHRQGMINKYIGDAIMAIWNTPLSNPDHGVMACRAALEMSEAVKAMRPLKMRIGINTGAMVAGNLGHRERMEYTVIGDSVNLASRLEGANKAFGTAILISETTEELVHDQFVLRQVDRIRVVGKEFPVAVFEVLAESKGDIDESVKQLVSSFQEVILAYEARQWPRAVKIAREHLRQFPSDQVTATYLSRCHLFEKNPPPDDWDGVYSLEAK